MSEYERKYVDVCVREEMDGNVYERIFSEKRRRMWAKESEYNKRMCEKKWMMVCECISSGEKKIGACGAKEVPITTVGERNVA